MSRPKEHGTSVFALFSVDSDLITWETDVISRSWTLLTVNDIYVVVPSDKARKHCFCMQTYYIQCLFTEEDIDNNSSNMIFTVTKISKEERVENHKSVLTSFGHSTKLLLWSTVYVLDTSTLQESIKTKLHSWICVPPNPFHFFNSVLTTAKEGLQSYLDTCYAYSCISSMWILKIRKIFWKSLIQDYYQNAITLEPMIF